MCLVTTTHTDPRRYTELTATTVPLPIVADLAVTNWGTVDLLILCDTLDGHRHRDADRVLGIAELLESHLHRTLGPGLARVVGSGRTDSEWDLDEDGPVRVPVIDVELILDYDAAEFVSRADVVAEIEAWLARIGVSRITRLDPTWSLTVTRRRDLRKHLPPVRPLVDA